MKQQLLNLLQATLIIVNLSFNIYQFFYKNDYISNTVIVPNSS